MPCGAMPGFWHVRVTDAGAENTWRPSGSDSWWRTLRCSTTASRIPRSAALLRGGMPGYLRNVNRCGAASSGVSRNPRPFL